MKTTLLSFVAAAGCALATCGAAVSATVTDEERETRATEGAARDHTADELRDPQSLKPTRRAAADIPHKPRDPAIRSPLGAATVSYGDSWIYDATIDLFFDYDNDGYYRYLRVRFDADTIYTSRYVYAEIYISADGTAWEHLYSTRDFALFGSDPDDDYEVETELIAGYSTALYDVLIELYDADTGELVDEFGPNESSELSLLPLEDKGRDGLLAPAPDSHSHGGGGAFSWWSLAALLGAVLRRRTMRA